MRPVYLGGSAGLFHAPTAPASGIAVLLVPPFGWDDQSMYRPRRDWANDLAAAGHAALRLDLPGTGDSAGGPRDPDQVSAWIAAVEDAATWLREGGAHRVTVIGIGVGGLITLAADAGEDVVLWGVAARGRAAIRELTSFGRLEASQTGEDPDATPDGEVRAGGHVLSPETAAAISALDARTLIAEGAPSRALVLARDGAGPDEKLLDALRGAGTEVETNAGRGWGAALAGPWAARAPEEVFAATRAWLAAVARPEAGITTAPADDSMTFEVDGVTMREHRVEIADGAKRLHGVLTEPVALSAAPGTAVLLNSGTIRHIGPNRMYTEAARRFAARGIPTLRLDVEGIGESDGDDRPYIESEAFYAPQLAQQARLALDDLEGRGLPTDFFVAGVCSGAYWGFQAALDDPRVKHVVMVNPRAFFHDPDAEPTREFWRAVRVFTPQGFRYMLMGERRLLRLGRLIRWIAGAPFRRLARSRGNTAGQHPRLTEAIHLLQDRGQSVELAFSVDEPLRDQLEADGDLTALRQAGVPVHDLPYISHTLRPVGAQQATHAVLDAAVETAFGAQPAPAA